MSYIILYTVLGLTALILISAALWNCLSTPRYNSIGEYLRKEGIPPRPKELRFKRSVKEIFNYKANFYVKGFMGNWQLLSSEDILMTYDKGLSKEDLLIKAEERYLLYKFGDDREMEIIESLKKPYDIGSSIKGNLPFKIVIRERVDAKPKP